jgi:hypothetical protein
MASVLGVRSLQSEAEGCEGRIVVIPQSRLYIIGSPMPLVHAALGIMVRDVPADVSFGMSCSDGGGPKYVGIRDNIIKLKSA